MGYIRRGINCNIFKGSKEKVDEENCEYDMVWDAEGSMHLVKRTTKAAVSSNEEGTTERYVPNVNCCFLGKNSNRLNR